MNNIKIISPCISICKNNPNTGHCFGCARSEKEKKLWKDPKTSNEWKNKNLNLIKSRMSESQLKIFEQSYKEKIEFGKLVYKKIQRKNHKIKPTKARIAINILTPNRYLVKDLESSISFFFPAPNLITTQNKSSNINTIIRIIGLENILNLIRYYYYRQE